MQFLLYLTTLLSLVVALHGETKVEDNSRQDGYFLCGNTYCLKDAFKCYHGYCYAKRQCTHNDHCPGDQYCDRYYQACRKGIRRCSHTQQCGYGLVCKGGLCKKRECIRHRDCPGNKYCYYPPGICFDYSAYCYHDNYCKSGYACVDKRCKKKECFNNYDCKIGDHCEGGFCKPKPGFCMKDGDCAKHQCCAEKCQWGGVCKDLRKQGAWCPLQQSMQTCPCVSGYVCNMKTSSIYWGKCEAADGASGSGSGSDDF